MPLPPEDYAGLEKLITVLPDGSPLLRDIGHKFASVGMSTEAVSAFLKSGDVKSAIDRVQQHHWEGAVQLAEAHNYPIQKAHARSPPQPTAASAARSQSRDHSSRSVRIGTQYASHLLDSGNSCTLSSCTAKPTSTRMPPGCSRSSPRRQGPRA